MSAYENLKSDNEILRKLKDMKDKADANSASATSIKAGGPNDTTIVRSYSASEPDTNPISANVQSKSLARTETTGNYIDIH